jgi:hypothetical protein
MGFNDTSIFTSESRAAYYDSMLFKPSARLWIVEG